MNFSTYGPFLLEEMASPGPEKFFDQIQNARADGKLQYGVGVYVVASRDEIGVLTPWYVGKTDSEFGKRFMQHIKQRKFESLVSKRGQLHVFMIALVTNTGRVKRHTLDKSKAINELEFAMIGSCLSVNPDLMNTQEKSFHSLKHVPGYWNSTVENYDDAARNLAEMLKPKNVN